MVAKISAFVQQIPAWIIWIAGFASIMGPDLVKGFTDANMPQGVRITQMAVTILSFLAAFAKQAETLKTKREIELAAAPRGKTGLPFLALVALFAGCTPSQAAEVQSAINAGLIIAGDVCQVVGAIDAANPPAVVKVSCTVANVAGQIEAVLPWSAWEAASKTTTGRMKAGVR